MVSFDSDYSDGDGASLFFFFFLKVSFLFPSLVGLGGALKGALDLD